MKEQKISKQDHYNLNGWTTGWMKKLTEALSSEAEVQWLMTRELVKSEGVQRSVQKLTYVSNIFSQQQNVKTKGILIIFEDDTIFWEKLLVYLRTGPSREMEEFTGRNCQNSTRAKTCTLTRKIHSTSTDWRTTVRTAYTSREVESKQNMDEQRTLAAMNPKRKLQWINKNPASKPRKGNNCWTTPGTW